MTQLRPDQIRQLFLAVHPVGSIFLTTSSTNPGSLYGGTWVAWGSGRVPVGVNASDSSFNTVEKTGGSSTHQHQYGIELSSEYFMVAIEDVPKVGAMQNGTGDGTGFTRTGEIIGAQCNGGYDASAKNVNTYLTKSTANTSSGSNLSPYITCYMWKRTE